MKNLSLALFSLLGLMFSACGWNLDLETRESKANASTKESLVYAIGVLHVNADGEETTETFAGNPDPEVLPVLATVDHVTGFFKKGPAESYRTLIEVEQTGEFMLHLDFSALRRALRENEFNIDLLESDPEAVFSINEDIEIEASLYFDIENPVTSTWFEAERATISSVTVAAQTERLRIRGMDTIQVLNQVEDPLLDFNLDIQFETPRGPIVITSQLQGFLTRWEGERHEGEFSAGTN